MRRSKRRQLADNSSNTIEISLDDPIKRSKQLSVEQAQPARSVPRAICDEELHARRKGLGRGKNILLGGKKL